MAARRRQAGRQRERAAERAWQRLRGRLRLGQNLTAPGLKQSGRPSRSGRLSNLMKSTGLEEQHHAERALIRLGGLLTTGVALDVAVLRHPAERLAPLIGELADDRAALEQIARALGVVG